MARTKLRHYHPFYHIPPLLTQIRPNFSQDAQVYVIDQLYCAVEVEPGAAMLTSSDYGTDLRWLGVTVDIDPDAPFRRDENGFSDSCQQASVALHKISISPTHPTHPHIPRWLRRDEWTGYGVIEKPTGMMLGQFLQQHRSVMYAGERIAPAFIPLLYQWALNALSAMEFCHHHKIIIADFGIWASWLESLEENLSLTLFGLHHAHFTDEYGRAYVGELCLGPRFSASQFDPRAKDWHWVDYHLGFTEKTDLFDWATFVYEIATGLHPLKNGSELRHMDATGSWPALEVEYLGDLVRKCWVRKNYEDAASVKRDLVVFLETKGWRVDQDNLVGFDATALPLSPTPNPL